MLGETNSLAYACLRPIPFGDVGVGVNEVRMCGFFFVVQRGKPIDADRFRDALSLSRHRGPDSSRMSVYSVADPNGFEPTAHIGAGFNRLSIIDLEHRSDQPFEREGCTLVFNGEIYNYKALRRELADRGATFTTSGDTEVLFNTILLDNLTSLDALNGMWAFCFHDRKEAMLYAARDRFGKKPIFYHHGPDVLCCSSNIAAILYYLKRTFAFRRPSLLAYLAGGEFWPSRDFTTHVESVDQIPAGHSFTFDLRNWSLTVARYFDVTTLPVQSAKDMQELADTFLDSVKLRLVSDRPIGLLLSGGVDSSLILSALHKSGLIDGVRCFVGDTGQGSDDVEYAKQSTDALKIKPTILGIQYGKTSFERFLEMCRHHEKPFPLGGNAMAMASMYEAMAGEGITVAIDGTGGDEFFGGYWRRYLNFAIRDAFHKRDLAWLAQMAFAGHTRAIVQLFRAGRKTPDTASAPLPYSEESAVSRDPLDGFDGTIGEASALDCAPGGRLGEWLWHNDRNAMMFSIENRSPLLDYRLATYLRTSYKHKFRGKWNKLLLRKLFDHFAPIPTQWRNQKEGFGWDRKRFIENNSKRIIELIDSSRNVGQLLDKDELVADMHAGRLRLRSRTAQRLLLLSAIEHVMRI